MQLSSWLIEIAARVGLWATSEFWSDCFICFLLSFPLLSILKVFIVKFRNIHKRSFCFLLKLNICCNLISRISRNLFAIFFIRQIVDKSLPFISLNGISFDSQFFCKDFSKKVNRFLRKNFRQTYLAESQINLICNLLEHMWTVLSFSFLFWDRILFKYKIIFADLPAAVGFYWFLSQS